MKCQKNSDSVYGTSISSRDATIFLLFVDLIISTLCVFLFVTTYVCNYSEEEIDENNYYLFAFFIWHASKLVIVSLGIVGSLKSIPPYLIPYICYWGFLTAFLLFYTSLVVILAVKGMNNNDDYEYNADQYDANETTTSYPIPNNKILEPKNILQSILEYSLYNVALSALIIIIIAAISGYFTIVIYGFYASLKESLQPQSELPGSPEVTGLPPEP